MVSNALTFHQVDWLNNRVNRSIQQNGGLYPAANISSHIGAGAVYAAGGVGAWNAAGGWAGIRSLAGGTATFVAKSCFPAGTPVHTSEGLKAIERVAVGDRVWAYDHKQLCWAEREVVEIYQLLHRGTMATIRVEGETLRATGGHPFWVVRGEGLSERASPVRIKPYELGGRQKGRWVLARDLRAGDEVLLRHGELVALESVRLDEVEETVYNFHVVELQNYAVGECGVLVHNTNDPQLTPAQREITASLNRLQEMRGIMDRMVAAHQRAIDRNLPATEQLARQAIYNQAERIAAEQAWFEFLLGGLP